jgi:histidine ammonia-lyase
MFDVELDSVTDNPLVFPDGDIVSGGNFHGQPLALALDYAAMALAELGSISERRTYLLLTGHDGLPTLLMRDTGLNSGFMIPQYTAAALVSQNKVLCHPSSVDSIPTCLGQEDHVSMGSIGAVKLLEVLENVEQILAIEALSASQGLDYRDPLMAGRGVDAAHRAIRAVVPHKEADAFFGDDIDATLRLLREGALLDAVQARVGELD